MPNGESMDTSEKSGNNPGPPGVVSPPNGVPLEVTADMAEEENSSQNEEREITQTDHLNKSLLTSFLSRLNDPNFRVPQPQSQDDEEEAEAIASASEMDDQQDQDRVEANDHDDGDAAGHQAKE